MKRKNEDLIMGRNCLLEVLKHAPERIKKVYIAKSIQNQPRKDLILSLIREENISIDWLPKQKLSSMVDSESHQSFVAQTTKRNYFDLKPFLADGESKENSMVLMLDNVVDPQNFGTILRVAECFGVDAVIWSKNRGVDITPVVTKVSCGASELLPLIKVSNLAESLRVMKQFDYEILTAEVNEKARSLPECQFPKKGVLVMGSEGEGIQPLIQKMADIKLYIPLYGYIESLNVSQATSIFLYQWKLAKMD